MFRSDKINEKFLYEVWKASEFKQQIKTTDNQLIEIIDSGESNKDFAGPDFFNSRIKIGDITYNGDVEIDVYHSYWKSHGHYLDRKYNKVILHVVLSKERFQPFVFTQEGRKVNSVCITDFIDDDFQSTIREAIKSEGNSNTFTMPCTEINGSVPVADKLELLSQIGINRFEHKEERILQRLKEMIYLKEMNIREPVVRYDFGEEFKNKKFTAQEFHDQLVWQQLLYEMIFEALGYSKNKDNMLKLAQAVNLNFLNNFKENSDYEEIIESALFNVSGILEMNLEDIAEETAEYLRKLIEKWASIKQQYDGQLLSKESWNYFKLRPQNFPTVRIAGGTRIVKKLAKDGLLGKIISAFTGNANYKKIITLLRNNMIIKASGFWSNHFILGKDAKVKINYFIGLSRADEIIINVILPALAVYFEVFDNKSPERKVKNLYLNYYQKGSNRIVTQVETSLNLTESKCKSVHHQGMIGLFRGYCVKEKCMECEIGKIVFN